MTLDPGIALFHGHHPACPYTIEGDWSVCRCGAPRLLNPWTTQELLDIYDRTADRPGIRAKIQRIVRP